MTSGRRRTANLLPQAKSQSWRPGLTSGKRRGAPLARWRRRGSGSSGGMSIFRRRSWRRCRRHGWRRSGLRRRGGSDRDRRGCRGVWRAKRESRGRWGGSCQGEGGRRRACGEGQCSRAGLVEQPGGQKLESRRVDSRVFLKKRKKAQCGGGRKVERSHRGGGKIAGADLARGPQTGDFTV